MEGEIYLNPYVPIVNENDNKPGIVNVSILVYLIGVGGAVRFLVVGTIG